MNKSSFIKCFKSICEKYHINLSIVSHVEHSLQITEDGTNDDRVNFGIKMAEMDHRAIVEYVYQVFNNPEAVMNIITSRLTSDTYLMYGYSNGSVEVYIDNIKNAAKIESYDEEDGEFVYNVVNVDDANITLEKTLLPTLFQAICELCPVDNRRFALEKNSVPGKYYLFFADEPNIDECKDQIIHLIKQFKEPDEKVLSFLETYSLQFLAIVSVSQNSVCFYVRAHRVPSGMEVMDLTTFWSSIL